MAEGCVWVAGWSMFVFAACERVWFAASPAAELQFVSVVSQSAICGLGWFLHIIAMATHNRLSQLLGFWAPGRHPSLCPTFAGAIRRLHRGCLSLFLPLAIVMGIECSAGGQSSGHSASSCSLTLQWSPRLHTCKNMSDFQTKYIWLWFPLDLLILRSNVKNAEESISVEIGVVFIWNINAIWEGGGWGHHHKHLKDGQQPHRSFF